MSARGLIVAAPRSGSGKTIVTLAVLAACRRRGLVARAVKSGPDYIDPAFHTAATGVPCPNVDSWAMALGLADAILADQARGAHVLLIEGAMGLFDGVDAPPGRRGAVADLAARHALPVLLVLDVSGQSQSAAAVARGFAAHDPAVRVAGVVLNRTGGERHRDAIGRAMAELSMPVFGALPRDATLALPERHLGLVQAGETDDVPALLANLADMAERHFDMDAIFGASAPLETKAAAWPVAVRPPGQRIALARDAAFSFMYPHVLAGWRMAGAEIFPFSPLADEAPPPGCDVCWLPGGYPELHAGRLAAAARFRDGLIRFAANAPVHGECGGYMALGESLMDAEGASHRMLGLLGHASSFARRKLHLGYRQVTLLADCAIGRHGDTLRGHEFHYATTAFAGNDAPLATAEDARGMALGPVGGRRGSVSGSFFHVIADAG